MYLNEKVAIHLKYHDLVHRGTWGLVPCPNDVDIINCRLAHHIAWLVLIEVTHAHDTDYIENLFMIICMNSIQVLLPLITNQN